MGNQKLSDEALLALLHEAIESFPDGFAIFDKNLRLIYSNSSIFKEFGFFYGCLERTGSYMEAAIATISRFRPDFTEEEVLETSRTLFERFKAGKSIAVPTEDGRFVRVRHILLGDGNVLAISADLTELNAQREQLLEAQAQAEAANEAKSQFLANVSHEVRNPLNGILGMAQVLSSSDLKPEQQDQIQVILDSGKTLLAILNDVLDLSKIEAGEFQISPVSREIRPFFERIVKLWEPTAADKDIRLTCTVSDNVPTHLELDPVRVRQCIGNLVSNAIKFTNQGHVAVDIWTNDIDGEKVKLFIRVLDTGVGIDAAGVEKIFVPFSQADNSITRRFGGTGLGLSITRNIAHLMGGTVTVISEPDQGSTFTLSLTCAYSDKDQDSELSLGIDPRPFEKMTDPNVRLLLVDDYMVNRQIARLFLRPLQYQIVEAENGQQALDLLAAQAFDLVLLDMHMPVLGGMGTIAAIRSSDAAWSQIPVIALTADAMSDDRQKCLDAGMDGYVAKPIDSNQLLSEIARVRTSKQYSAAAD